MNPDNEDYAAAEDEFEDEEDGEEYEPEEDEVLGNWRRRRMRRRD